MEKEYICKCGKHFNSSQSFNAHQGKCKIHLGEERYNKILLKDKANLLKANEKITEIRLETKIKKEKEWIEEQHHCEFCHSIMTERYGSGRFCSKECAKKFSNQKRKKIKAELKKTGKKAYCEICGKELKKNQSTTCSINCANKKRYRDYINKWKNGEIDFKEKKLERIPSRIRHYMLEKANYKCEKCGWSEINPSTGLIPLQIHHIDGDPYNHIESNLQVLCPNCHSLTETFGSLNIGNGRAKNKWHNGEE